MIGVIPAYFNRPSARYTPVVCVVVLLLNAWAVGQNSRPGSVPFIPDTRKPSRNIQPSLIPAAQPKSTQETVGGENIFSPFMQFLFCRRSPETKTGFDLCLKLFEHVVRLSMVAPVQFTRVRI